MIRVLLALLVVSSTAHSDHFDENLVLRPLRDGHVLAHFSFRVLWNVSASSGGDDGDK